MSKYLIFNSNREYRIYHNYRNYTIKIDYAVGAKQEYAALALLHENQTLWMGRFIKVANPYLMPHVNTWIIGDYVLVWSAGEHPRGASLHEHQLHCLALETGDLLWTKQRNVSIGVVLSGKKLYWVETLNANSYDYKPHLLDVLEVDILTGKENKRIPILISDAKLEEAKNTKKGTWIFGYTLFKKEGKQLLLCSRGDHFSPIVIA